MIAMNQKILKNLLCILKSSTFVQPITVVYEYTFGQIPWSLVFLNNAIALFTLLFLHKQSNKEL